MSRAALLLLATLALAAVCLPQATPATEVDPASLIDEQPDGARREHLQPADARYRSPIQLALTGDGQRLLVVCERSNLVQVVDTATSSVIAEVPVGRHPFAITLSPDEHQAYVSNRWDDTVSVIDLQKLEVTATIKTGGDPHGLVTSRDGGLLYVTNLADHDLSVISLAEQQELKRLKAGKQPFDICRSPDGHSLYVSNQLTSPVPFRTAPRTELTIIDADRNMVSERRDLALTDIAQGIAASPDGELVLVTLEIPKNLIPETQIYQGWMVTYGIAVVETAAEGRAALLLIDEMNLYYADPFAVVFSPDGRLAYVSSSGVDTITVIDMARVRDLLAISNGRIGVAQQQLDRFARHLSLSTEYVVARISTGHNPKGMAMAADGSRLYVANRLADTISVFETATNTETAVIELGGPDETTLLRHGEYLFNHAVISFQRQMACNTCHPESNVDGLIYDIAVDGGLGGNLVDNRTMRGVAETGPFKWSGKNPSLARQEGPRAAQLFFRSHGFTGDDRDAVVAFLESVPLPPLRHRPAGTPLSPAQERGKQLFTRSHTNEGHYIPVANRCITCHPPPYFTDRARHDVGTRAYFDTSGMVDTPQLGRVSETAPFLHDGRCWSLEEIWTLYNPYDLHGVANDLTKHQLNDLIEYLKTL